MSDLITLARTYLKTHLDNNALSLSESSAVQAMVGFFQENAQPAGSTVAVEETPEYKLLEEENDELDFELDQLTTELSQKKLDHENDIKQRDYNWSELQKAKAEVVDLQTKLDVATSHPIPGPEATLNTSEK